MFSVSEKFCVKSILSTNMLRPLYIYYDTENVYNHVNPDFRRFEATQSSREKKTA